MRKEIIIASVVGLWIVAPGCKQAKKELDSSVLATNTETNCEFIRAKPNYVVPVFERDNTEVRTNKAFGRESNGNAIYAITLEDNKNLIGIKVFGPSELADGKLYYVSKSSANFECVDPDAKSRRNIYQSLLKNIDGTISASKIDPMRRQSKIANGTGFVVCEGEVKRTDNNSKFMDYRVFSRYGHKNDPTLEGKVSASLVHMKLAPPLRNFNDISQMEFALPGYNKNWHTINSSNKSFNFEYKMESGKAYLKGNMDREFFPSHQVQTDFRSNFCTFYPDAGQSTPVTANSEAERNLSCSGPGNGVPYIYKITGKSSGIFVSADQPPFLEVQNKEGTSLFARQLNLRGSRFKQKEFEYLPQFSLVQFKLGINSNTRKYEGTASITHRITPGSLPGQVEVKEVTSTISCKAN